MSNSNKLNVISESTDYQILKYLLISEYLIEWFKSNVALFVRDFSSDRLYCEYPRAFQHRARAVKPRNGSAGAKTKLGEKQDGAAEGQFDLPPEEWRWRKDGPGDRGCTLSAAAVTMPHSNLL